MGGRYGRRMQTLPYGAWPSPISAADVATAGRSIGFVSLLGDEVWWNETRPSEGGRVVVVRRKADGETVDAVGAPWHPRTRVHEYGGRAWLPLAGAGGAEPDVVFAHWDDQRLYLMPGGSTEPRPLTPEPDEPAGLRYADLVLAPSGAEVLAIRERHRGGTVDRHVVAVPLDGSAAHDPGNVREVAGGSHFLANPRVSPDGSRLLWLAWEHPNMPWDGCELRVAELTGGVAGEHRTVAGGATESIFQPEWVDDGHVYLVSDRSGWWNLYRLELSSGELTALAPREEEFGTPLWVLGMSKYAVLGDGRIAAVHGAGTSTLGILDPTSGELTDLDLPYTVWGSQLGGSPLQADDERLVAVVASPTTPPTVVRLTPSTGAVEEIRSALDSLPDHAYLPRPTAEALKTPDGGIVHANVYAPRNPEAQAPEGELPPYVVFVHGGPTANSPAALSIAAAFFTSRGIGVLDVNYGGSSGYGREYRERLRLKWGLVDVADCIAAAQALVDRGDADPARIAIRGGSAGGWTTLAAVTSSDFFACGASYFGVAELLRFAEDTHDFESRYLDGLIGKLPEDRNVYVERAPLSHVDEVRCPVLLLQGLEDQVVPPSQSEMFRDALAAKGIPHAYIAFEGEQHGFRKAENIITSHESELSFYGQVMGFEPPGIPKLELS